ncbi:hypothetical protein [Vibrio fluvialis]|uniref:hypothetical protein n=1 Tax=Vibrio fluvialis TaxID=676 RepID=UPI00041626F2
MNYPGIQNALLFSEESLTSTMLKETLGRNLPLSVELQRFNPLSIEKSTCAKYIFIDFAHITDEFENNYYNIKYQIGLHAKEILINCPRDISVAYLFKWPNLYGVFYADDYIDKILQAPIKSCKVKCGCPGNSLRTISYIFAAISLCSPAEC